MVSIPQQRAELIYRKLSAQLGHVVIKVTESFGTVHLADAQKDFQAMQVVLLEDVVDVPDLGKLTDGRLEMSVCDLEDSAVPKKTDGYLATADAVGMLGAAEILVCHTDALDGDLTFGIDALEGDQPV